MAIELPRDVNGVIIPYMNFSTYLYGTKTATDILAEAFALTSALENRKAITIRNTGTADLLVCVTTNDNGFSTIPVGAQEVFYTTSSVYVKVASGTSDYTVQEVI